LLKDWWRTLWTRFSKEESTGFHRNERRRLFNFCCVV